MPVAPSKVILAGLDQPLAEELRAVLRILAVEIVNDHRKRPALAFCSARFVPKMRLSHPGLPVIVVSSQRHVTEWLDAMEAGAADYCAAPFEPAHMGWILQSNLRPSVHRAA